MPSGPQRLLSPAYTCLGTAIARRTPIYTLPVIVVAFAFIFLFAYLTELPLWMVGVAAVLALVGYFLERKRPT